MPDPSVHIGTPTNRAGTPTARHASTRRIESPEHDASPDSIDSLGAWSARRLFVEYFTPVFAKSALLSIVAACAGVVAPSIMGSASSRSDGIQSSRFSLTLA